MYSSMPGSLLPDIHASAAYLEVVVLGTMRKVDWRSVVMVHVTVLRPLHQDLEVEGCHTLAAESLANLPASLRRLRLSRCFNVPARSLAHLGRLPALEHLALSGLPRANGDEGLQQLAPQLHARLSALHFTGCIDEEVSAVP